MSEAQALATALPKLAEQALGSLPKVSEEDLQKIRSSFPGKVLARTAALLSLGLLVLGFTVLGKYGLGHLGIDLTTTRPWLGYGLLLGLPALAVLSQITVEWRAERNRLKLKELAVQHDPEQSGYFRIGPYMAEDRAQFRRADHAHEKVLQWIEASQHAVLAAQRLPLYLTGDSGSGKSSILNAWVLPTLRERNWTVVEARAWQDPEAALREALAPLASARRTRQDAKPGLRTLIESAARRPDAGLLLVLDQFEEFVILGTDEAKTAFAGLIADLRKTPIAGFTLLLVLRSDYQTFLEEIGLPTPLYGENLFQIGRFKLRAAAEFIARSGLGLQPDSVDRLLTSAAELDQTPDLVRPITLNVIGHVLAASGTVAPTLDAGQLVHRYIAQTVDQPAFRDLAPPILEQLITEQSTKRPRSEQELAEATHLRRGEIRAVLNGLAAAALVRPLDRAAAIWELSHDFVARAVARYLGRRRHDGWRRGASYAAPTLLTAALLGIGGAVAFEQPSPYKVRAELSELGLKVIPSEGGMTVKANLLLTPAGFTRSGPLLRKLMPIRSLDLSPPSPFEAGPRNHSPLWFRSDIADLKPLKGLTSLQSLNLGGTSVANLEPLKSLSSLERLDIGGTQVEDLEPLKDLPALGSLVVPDAVSDAEIAKFHQHRSNKGLGAVKISRGR